MSWASASNVGWSVMSVDFTLDLPDEAATLALGRLLAPALQANMTVYLQGDLGAGKTTLVRGLLRALGFNGKVKSPTYTLIETYPVSLSNQTPVQLCHFDLYRFKSPHEWEDAGFSEFINTEDVTIVEWPEMAKGILPKPDLLLNFFHHDDLSRNMTISSLSKRGDECLHYLS